MSPAKGPLTDKDYATINDKLAELQRLETELARAEQAGCDVGEKKAYCQYLRDRLAKFKSTYFPDRP